MAKSTGPILAVGGITFVNNTILNKQGVDIRPLIGAGFAAGALALVERANERLATAIAWTALVSVLFVRLRPNVPSPVETALKVWNKGVS